jgi:hypothetical protein
MTDKLNVGKIVNVRSRCKREGGIKGIATINERAAADVEGYDHWAFVWHQSREIEPTSEAAAGVEDSEFKLSCWGFRLGVNNKIPATCCLSHWAFVKRKQLGTADTRAFLRSKRSENARGVEK